jgi:hypothetical protein
VRFTLTVFDSPGDMVSVTEEGDQDITGVAGDGEGVRRTTAHTTRITLRREKINQKGFCLIKEIILLTIRLIYNLTTPT